MLTRLLVITALAVLGLAGGEALAATAPKKGTFAGTLGIKPPKGAQADVRAVSRADGTIAAARPIKRSGAFSLTLSAGSYLVVGTIVNPGDKVTVVKSAVSLRAGQKRAKANLKKKRKRKKSRRASGRAAYVQELGQVTPGRLAAQIPDFTGNATGDFGAVRRGLNDLMTTDVFTRGERCDLALIEVDRRADMLRELEFQQSPYVDPSTRLTRNLIVADVEVRGTINDAGGGRVQLDVRLVDLNSGQEYAHLTRTTGADGFFDVMEKLGSDTADELCKLHDVYEVTLDVRGDANFATHSGTGTIRSTLRARRTEPDRAVWRDSGPLAWQGLSFTPKIQCAYIDPVATASSWSVTILDGGDGNLQVTWIPQGSLATTVSVDCPPDGGTYDPPPIAGQPGPSLIAIAPMSFTVPYAGGMQAISGVVAEGADGFFNAGTITVKRSGIAAPGG